MLLDPRFKDYLLPTEERHKAIEILSATISDIYKETSNSHENILDKRNIEKSNKFI